MKKGASIARVLSTVRILLLCLCVSFMISFSFAQSPSLASSDSIVKVTISPERVPTASGAVIQEVLKLGESLVTDARLTKLRNENDSLLKLIDSLLIAGQKVNYRQLSNRQLNNVLNFWNERKNKISGERDKLSGIIDRLFTKRNTLIEKSNTWGNTRKKYEATDTWSSIGDIIIESQAKIDSIIRIIDTKANILLDLMNQTTRRSIQTESFINDVKSILNERQSITFTITQPSIFSVEYSNKEQWELQQYFTLFVKSDLVLLKNYFQLKKITFYYYFVYLVVLIILFLYVHRKIQKLEIDSTTIYKSQVKQIFSRPVSAALVLGLFSTVLFFPGRPPVFIDLSILFSAIPLFIIVFTLARHLNKNYIIVLAILLLLRFVSHFFHLELIIYRLIMLTMLIIELITLIYLERDFRKQEMKNQYLQNFIRLFIWIHIFFAASGILAELLGSSLFATMMANLIVSVGYLGILLSISAIIVIGLVHFAIDGKYLQRLNFVRKNNYYLKKRATGIIVLLALLFWIINTLKIIGVYDNLSEGIADIFEREYNIGSASFSIGGILLFFFVIWLSVIISKIIRVILEDDVLERFSLKKGVPRLISVMTRYTIITIGVFLAIAAAGMPLDNLTIIFGAFSVGIGFGLQNIFNNLVSGLILLFERPIQIGDVVEVGPLLGTVKSMGIRSSNVRTFDGAEVIVPNGHLISNEVTNWTLSDNKRRIEIISGVAYGSDVHKTHKLFIKILQDHPDILQDPEPKVYFNDLGESSLDFRLLFWTDNMDEWLRIRSEIVFKVHDVLYEEGISIPFPQRDLHIRTIEGKSIIQTGKEKEEKDEA